MQGKGWIRPFMADQLPGPWKSTTADLCLFVFSRWIYFVFNFQDEIKQHKVSSPLCFSKKVDTHNNVDIFSDPLSTVKCWRFAAPLGEAYNGTVYWPPKASITGHVDVPKNDAQVPDESNRVSWAEPKKWFFIGWFYVVNRCEQLINIMIFLWGDFHWFSMILLLRIFKNCDFPIEHVWLPDGKLY